MAVTTINTPQIRNDAVTTAKILDANVTLAKVVLLTKGALITSTGAANASLAVGTDGFVLTANSGVANGIEWAASPGATSVPLADFIFSETPSGTINGINATFTLANVPEPGTVRLYLNGIRQNAGAGNDYTISGDTITMLNVPVSGDVLLADYIVDQ